MPHTFQGINKSVVASSDILRLRCKSGKTSASDIIKSTNPSTAKHTCHNPQPQALLALLKDPQTAPFSELPDTGVGLATESLLSSVFIASPSYGTRASTALIVNADGSRVMVEHSFGPHGGRLGEVRLAV